MVDIDMLSEDADGPLSMFETALTELEPADVNVKVVHAVKTMNRVHNSRSSLLRQLKVCFVQPHAIYIHT